jgi:hypothetical protein
MGPDFGRGIGEALVAYIIFVGVVCLIAGFALSYLASWIWNHVSIILH